MMSAGVDSSQSPSTSMTADRTYELQVVQNPIRARMCGFGEKDRRPIDPPPIVKLTVRNADGTIEDARSLDISTYVVHADVWSADRSVPRTLVINPSSVPQPSPTSLGVQAMGDSSMSVMSMCVPTSTRNLMGSLVSSAFLLQGLDQEPGIYFIFQDLSVRSDGVFTLRFTFALLFDAENPERTPIHTEAFSEPFTIYPAKRFPGMTESTKLSKCFASQGIKIPIRKEPRVRRVPAKTSTTTTGTETASSTTHHHQDNDPNRRGSIAGYNSSTSSSSQMQEGEMDYYDDDEEDYDDDMTG